MIIRLLGIASLADAAWQLFDRSGWAQFWERSLVKLRRNTPAARAVAAGELLLGLWLTFRPQGAWRGGHEAKFRGVSEEHPITAA